MLPKLLPKNNNVFLKQLLFILIFVLIIGGFVSFSLVDCFWYVLKGIATFIFSGLLINLIVIISNVDDALMDIKMNISNKLLFELNKNLKIIDDDTKKEVINILTQSLNDSFIIFFDGLKEKIISKFIEVFAVFIACFYVFVSIFLDKIFRG